MSISINEQPIRPHGLPNAFGGKRMREEKAQVREEKAQELRNLFPKGPSSVFWNHLLRYKDGYKSECKYNNIKIISRCLGHKKMGEILKSDNKTIKEILNLEFPMINEGTDSKILGEQLNYRYEYRIRTKKTNEVKYEIKNFSENIKKLKCRSRIFTIMNGILFCFSILVAIGASISLASLMVLSTLAIVQILPGILVATAVSVVIGITFSVICGKSFYSNKKDFNILKNIELNLESAIELEYNGYYYKTFYEKYEKCGDDPEELPLYHFIKMCIISENSYFSEIDRKKSREYIENGLNALDKKIENILNPIS